MNRLTFFVITLFFIASQSVHSATLKIENINSYLYSCDVLRELVNDINSVQSLNDIVSFNIDNCENSAPATFAKGIKNLYSGKIIAKVTESRLNNTCEKPLYQIVNLGVTPTNEVNWDMAKELFQIFGIKPVIDIKNDDNNLPKNALLRLTKWSLAIPICN